jgi:glycosyltransferase involved in cell wall biosynthesis
MLNEAQHIQQFINDLASQDLELPIEVFVADGCSDDGSPEVLRDAARMAGIDLDVIENPARSVSHGLNACIRRTTGDLIVRLDCHTRYPPDYLSRCLRAVEETGAWNAGGVVIPLGGTRMERAVGYAMDSPFGGIVWSRHNGSERRVAVDTVPYGAFPRHVFDRVGLFDEDLVRDQDDEFNLRLRKAGGTVILDPSIRLYYVPRGSLRAAARQYYEYGFWKVPVMLKHGQVLGARSLAPIAFVSSLGGLIVASVWSRWARRLVTIELISYGGCALVFALRAVRRNNAWDLLPRVMGAFMTFHVSYGVGNIHGWLAAALRRTRGHSTA